MVTNIESRIVPLAGLTMAAEARPWFAKLLPRTALLTLQLIC